VTFYSDENISPIFADMLKHYCPEHPVIAHRDRFEQGTADDVWLPVVAAWTPKPVTLLGDGRILRKPQLKIIARGTGMSFVVMAESFMNLPFQEQTWKFFKVWPDIIRLTTKARSPTIFDVKIRQMEVIVRHFTATLQ